MHRCMVRKEHDAWTGSEKACYKKRKRRQRDFAKKGRDQTMTVLSFKILMVRQTPFKDSYTERKRR